MAHTGGRTTRSVGLDRARARIVELASLNAFISLTDEEGDGPIVAVKDLIDVRGTITTGGGTIRPNVPAVDDAPVIDAIRRHGCLVIGKTNLHEWAFGATSENPHYGPVRNPDDPLRVAGGSSGGSAVAVATEMCDWAIGTDTGGSIRIPASLCGVVGFKPTYGLVPAEGVIPLSPSLDTVGPLAADVLSAARALEMLTGRADLVPEISKPLSAFRLAAPHAWVEGLDGQTQEVWDRIGANLSGISLPERSLMEQVGLTILQREAAVFHRDWMERYPDRYDPIVLARLREAAQVSEAEYSEALFRKERLRRDVEEAMDGLDAILLPATACIAPLIGQANINRSLTCFTRPFNVTGQPVIVIPAPASGLPVGIQVVGKGGDDARVVEVALGLEKQWSGTEPAAPQEGTSHPM